MKTFKTFFLLLLFYNGLFAQVSQFPQVYYNGQGVGGFNLNIHSSYSSSSSILERLSLTSKIGAESPVTNNGDLFMNFIKVCLPSTSSTNNVPNYGFMPCNEFYARINESNNFATVNTTSTPLGVRTCANCTSSYVTNSGQNNTYYGKNSILALTGNVSSGWYEVYLPFNYSQSTGWVNGIYLTFPNSQSYYNVGGRICDNVSNCNFSGSINQANIQIGSLGTTYSSNGFYEYKVPTNWSGIITCSHPSYNTSSPTSYNHNANFNNYTRNFVLSNSTSCTGVSIGTQPQSQNGSVGGTASFSVVVNGTPPFSYFWYKNGVQIPNTNSSSYTTPVLTASDNGNTYYCNITNCNQQNGITSNSAILTVVTSSCSGVSISTQPQPQNASVGGTASFSVVVNSNGTAPFTYQWKKNGNNISLGATSQTYNTPTLALTDNGNTYSCFISNCNGTQNTTSNTALLTVTNSTSTPTASFSISQNTITQGGTITTTNTSTGNPTPTYTWTVSPPSTSVSFLPSPSATNPNITFANTGSYNITLTASNTNGSNSTSRTITVTTVGATPTYWIGFYNKVDGNAGLNWEKELVTATSNMTNPTPVKICADGSKSTIVRVRCSDSTIDMTQIKFRIANFTSTNYDGYFNGTDYTSTLIQAETRYSHANVMTTPFPPYEFDTRIIQVYNQNNPSVNLFTFPIQIYRAPLLMVHGLWGDVTSFSGLENYLLNSSAYPSSIFSSPLTFRLDYKDSNDSSFGYNSQSVPEGINKLLYQARLHNYSAGKVDIVAHSMGGLLARIYLENIYQNQYRNDIHKFITLNTPHSGTQAANMLWFRDFICGITRHHMNSKIGCPDAIENLRVNSSDIGLLNNSLNLSLNLVPTFAIVTNDKYIGDYANCEEIINSLINFVASINSFSNGNKLLYLNNLFDSEDSDLIVPISSQQGGIDKNQHFQNQCHMKSSNNPNIHYKVLSLINYPLNSANFDINGFNPPILAVPNTAYFKSTEQQATTSNLNIHINFPSNNNNFSSGSTIQIITSGDNSISNLSVYAGNTYIQDFSQVSNIVNNSFQYTIPIDAIGKILIQIIGVDGSGNIATDSVTINVTPTATLNSISNYPLEHFIPVGGLAHTNIVGHYSDGIDRNISDILGLSINISESNVARTSSNLIYGVSVGTTTATFSYQGKSLQIPIEIYKGEEWLTYGIKNYSNNGNSNSALIEDYLRIVPNPNNGQFSVEANNLVKGNIQIEIFNLLGKKIFNEELDYNLEIFHHEIDLKNFSSGIYLIRLNNIDKQYTGKIIKN